MVDNDSLHLDNITLAPPQSIVKGTKEKALQVHFVGSYRKSVTFAVRIPAARQPPKVPNYSLII